jgi:hypothetical protein
VIAHEVNNRESTQSSRSLPFVATLHVLEFLRDGNYKKKLLGGYCVKRPLLQKIEGYNSINIVPAQNGRRGKSRRATGGGIRAGGQRAEE